MYKLLLFLCCLSSLSFGQLGRADFDLPYGTYDAGFKTVDLKDTTRQFANFKTREGQTYRPVQACIWYPAAPKHDAQQMHLRDYFRSAFSPQQFLNFQAPPDKLSKEDKKTIAGYFQLRSDQLETMLETECNAYYNAEAHIGPFPLIVYSPGANAPAFENHLMFEFLASHGFVVISHKSFGSKDIRLIPNAQSLDDQFNDLEMLLSYAKTLPYVHQKQVATVGHSWGGSANVLLAMKYPEVKGVVGLDGSIAYHHDTAYNHPAFVKEGFSTPFLFARNNAKPEMVEKMRLDTGFAYYNNLKTQKKIELQFTTLRHTDFASIMLQWLDTDIGGEQESDKAKLAEGYKWLCLYTYHFLNYVVRNDYNSRSFLKYEPSHNGAAFGLVKHARKAGSW